MSLTLLRGGRIYDSDGTATAMVVHDERVAYVGADDTAAAYAGSFTSTVDLGGALVTPAFVDAHVHSTATGLALGGLNLEKCISVVEMLDRVAAHGAGDEPVLGHGWDEQRMRERRPPTNLELDRAAGGRPVYLSRVDLHAAAVSSSLLVIVDRGLAGYRESGHLTARAHDAARQAATALVTPAQRVRAHRLTRRRAAERGIGLIHELGGPEISSDQDLAAMLALARTEPGPDVVGYWGELGGVERARELGALGAAGDIFADGTIGSHTACLRRVYLDAEVSGEAYLTAVQVRDHVVACALAGLQAGFHAIGDGAVATVVAGYEEAAARVGADVIVRGRHRIEHVEMADASLVARIAALGLHASVQPAFDALWGGQSGMYADRLGARRAVELNPFAALHMAGINLAFGSDSPVTPIDPWAAVQAAAFHHNPAHRLDLGVAFAAHTVGGWRAAGRDDAGRLVPGAPASYAIWNTDRFPGLSPGTAPPECVRTVVRGRTVYP